MSYLSKRHDQVYMGHDALRAGYLRARNIRRILLKGRYWFQLMMYIQLLKENPTLCMKFSIIYKRTSKLKA
jgi:hypothetical protein